MSFSSRILQRGALINPGLAIINFVVHPIFAGNLEYPLDQLPYFSYYLEGKSKTYLGQELIDYFVCLIVIENISLNKFINLHSA